MNSSKGELSVQQALAFPFQGKDWQGRFAIGLAVLLSSFFIPFLPAMVVYGYLLGVMRMAIDGKVPSLPEWTDWSDLLKEGFQAFVVGFAYLLPGIVVLTAGTGLYCVASFVLPFAAEAQAASGASEGLYIIGLMVALLVFFASMAIGSTLTLLGALPLPMAAGSLAASQRMAEAFRLRRLWRILVANGMGFLTGWIVLIGIWTIDYLVMTFAYFTLVLACLIPILVLPLGLYSLLVGAALFGDAYRVSQQNLAQAGG